jgi:hypothetical protein
MGVCTKMNEIHHKQVIITFDICEPFDKQSQEDLDHVISLIKEKKLFSHCGNVRLTVEDK